ncbi:hypothetical protein ABPG72_014294 [Tetrahymena utriculariae]
MIIRGVKKEDCVIRGDQKSPKQCRVHARSLIELKKHLKEINYQDKQSNEQIESNQQQQATDIQKITRQFSNSFFNTKNRNSRNSRLKTDEERQSFHNNSQQQNLHNNKFVPFIHERDRLGRLITENQDQDDDLSVFTYRPNTYRKHAKSTDTLKIKNLPTKSSNRNDGLNKHAYTQLKQSGLFREQKAEDQLIKNKIAEMIQNHQLENKILLGVNRQNNYEVQQQDNYNDIQMISYRLNIKHQEDLQRKQQIANSLTYARGFYKRAQADEQYRRVKTNHSSHRIQTMNTEEEDIPQENQEKNDLNTKNLKNKNYFLNLRKQTDQSLQDQLRIFKKRNNDILNNPVPPLGFYDAPNTQENCILKKHPNVIFNKQERFITVKAEENEIQLNKQKNSPQKSTTALKAKQGESQKLNKKSISPKKQQQDDNIQQKFKTVADSSVAKIDQINPKIFEQIKEQEERRFRIEKNIDQIALDFNSEKASTIFTQNFLQTKQKMRRIRNNLSNMEFDTLKFFDQLIQQQQKKQLDDGLI